MYLYILELLTILSIVIFITVDYKKYNKSNN